MPAAPPAPAASPASPASAVPAPSAVPVVDPATTRRHAARALLVDRLRLGSGDHLLVAFDPARAADAALLVAHARLGGVTARLAALPAPTSGRVARLAARAVPPGGGAAALVVLGGAPLTGPVPALPGRLTAVQFPDGEGLLPDPVRDAGTAAVLASLHARTAAAAQVRVRTGGDAELRLVRDTAAPPAVDPGLPGPGRLTVLPAERLDCPVASADGIFTADAGARINRPLRGTGRPGTGGPVPVTVELHDGRVTAVDCPDPLLRGLLRRAVLVHHADTLTAVHAGPAPGGAVRVCLGLSVDPARTYSAASADLRISLDATAAWDTEPEQS